MTETVFLYSLKSIKSAFPRGRQVWSSWHCTLCMASATGSHWKNTAMSLGLEGVLMLHGFEEVLGAECSPSLANNRSSPLIFYSLEIMRLGDVSAPLCLIVLSLTPAVLCQK